MHSVAFAHGAALMLRVVCDKYFPHGLPYRGRGNEGERDTQQNELAKQTGCMGCKVSEFKKEVGVRGGANKRAHTLKLPVFLDIALCHCRSPFVCSLPCC